MFEIFDLINWDQAACEFNIINAADEINQALEVYEIRETAVLGSSMGAMIAIELAQRFSQKVSCFILSSLPIEPTPLLGLFIANLESSVQVPPSVGDYYFQNLLPVFFSPAFAKQDRFQVFSNFLMGTKKNYSKDVLIAQLFSVNKWIESKRWIGPCKQPCLFIYGSDDQLVSIENTVSTLNNAFREPEVKIINEAGHLVHIEKYREFNVIVHDFLKKSLL